MGIMGTVKTTLAVGDNTIKLPKAGLTIIGIQVNSVDWLKIKLDPANEAVLVFAPAQTPPPIFKFTYVCPTNQIIVNSSTADEMYLYYGTPLPGSRPLSAYKGVLATAVEAAGGSGSFTLDFPVGGKKASGILAVASASWYYVNFSTATGESLYYYGFPNVLAYDLAVTPVDFVLPDSLTVNITYNAALTYYVVVYYQ